MKRGKMVAVVVLLVPVVFALAVGLAWARQERIAYQPPRQRAPVDSTIEKISYEAADGQELFAYLVGDLETARGIVLAFHGNAVEASTQIGWARELHARTGWALLLPEYRGYAGLSGAPSYQGVKLDSQAALAALNRLLAEHDRDSGISSGAGNGGPTDVNPAGGAAGPATPSQQLATFRIAYFGHSIGTAVASELAKESPPSVLVLQSPLTTARDMARIIVIAPLHALWKWISRIHYDTMTIVTELDAPVWIAHGRRDLITPVSMGRRVHEVAQVKGELLIVNSAGHNDVAEQGGEDYWRWLAAALK